MSGSRPSYAVVNKSSRSQKKNQSFSRRSFAQSHHPNLPTSGAKRVARQSTSDDNKDFMSTPESGVCGSVFFLCSSFHMKSTLESGIDGEVRISGVFEICAELE